MVSVGLAFIAVVGGGRCSQSERAMAEAVGVELARRGAVLVCGGLGGVMEAASKGARSVGGLTVGILPGSGRQAANEYVSVPIPTGLGEARNVLVVKAAQVVIAIGGEYGTLSEIALALKMGVPVVGVGTWSMSKRGKSRGDIVVARDADEAVSLAFRLLQKAPEGALRKG